MDAGPLPPHIAMCLIAQLDWQTRGWLTIQGSQFPNKRVTFAYARRIRCKCKTVWQIAIDYGIPRELLAWPLDSNDINLARHSNSTLIFDYCSISIHVSQNSNSRHVNFSDLIYCVSLLIRIPCQVTTYQTIASGLELPLPITRGTYI
jgi:hypothetical protein